MSVLALVRTTSEAAAADVTAMKQNLVDYWNAVANINANSFAIVKTELKKIDEEDYQPPWWYELSDNFSRCQGHATFWLDTIYPSLVRVPQSIITYNTFFSITSRSVFDLIRKVAFGTATAADRRAIKDKLGLLVRQLGTARTQVADVRVDIRAFTDQLADDHRALTSGAASVTEALKANKKEVERLNKLIDDLKDELKSLQEELGITEVAAGVSIGLLVLSCFFGGWFGLIACVIGWAGVIGSGLAWLHLKEEAQKKIAEIE